MNDGTERNPSQQVRTETSSSDGHKGNARADRRVLLFINSILSLLRPLARRFAANAPTPSNSIASDERSGRKRASDCNQDPQIDAKSHQRWGFFFVTCALLVTVAGAVGFLFIYWSNGNNLLLGGCLAFASGGLGVTLVLYAHWLTLHLQATEPREPLASPPLEEAEAVETVYSGIDEMRRRTLLKWIVISAVTMVAGFVISLLRSFQRPPGPTLFSTVWKTGQRLMTPEGTPVTVNALEPGNQFMIVFPEDSIGDERAQTMLLRVKPEELRLPWNRSNWAPMGYLAYSRVCTHAGCDVALYETTTHELMCPCHQSTFDILHAAEPTGGPAARPLPQLPLSVDSDGVLRAAGGFSEPPGPGFWWMPTPGVHGSVNNV